MTVLKIFVASMLFDDHKDWKVGDIITANDSIEQLWLVDARFIDENI